MRGVYAVLRPGSRGTGGYPGALLPHGDQHNDGPCGPSLPMPDRLKQHGGPRGAVAMAGLGRYFYGRMTGLAVRAAVDRVPAFLPAPP